MNPLDKYTWSKYNYKGPSNSYTSCNERFRVPEEFQRRQEIGKDITKDAILDLRILLGVSKTIDDVIVARINEST